MKKRTLLLVSLFVFVANNAVFYAKSSAQSSGSDIFVAKLNMSKKPSISELVAITDSADYSNQPYFFNNNLLFYTQAVTDEGADASSSQMDSFVFDFTLGEGKNLTQSSANEYSPTPLPYKEGMSVIRVADDGKQELWAYNAQGKAEKHLVPKVEPVGYQVWINNNELLLFVLGEQSTLQRVDISQPDELGVVIDSNVGASLYRFKDSSWILYTNTTEDNYLNAYNIDSKKTEQLFKMPKGAQYFTVTPSGMVLTSDGERVMYRHLIATTKKPMALADWGQLKIDHAQCKSGVSRMAVSPDQSMLALVCSRKDK